MRRWFSRIASREDALHAIGASSTIFFIVAGLQIIAALLIFANHAKPGYSPLQDETLFNMVATAAIILSLAAVLYAKDSRVAAVLLLIVSVVIAAASLLAPIGAPRGNLIAALIAIWAGARATLATFRLYGQFAETNAGGTENQKVDGGATFIGHPDGGMEPKESKADSGAHTQTFYDREKWATLLKYDDDLAMAAVRIKPLGQRWSDELARAYLVLNDKQYLQRIEAKIVADAQRQATIDRFQNPTRMPSA